MTSLEDLTRLAPPPPHARPTDWNAAETLLGTRLPSDYKQFADAYGPGAFCGFLHVYHPHGPTPWVDLTGPMPSQLREQLVTDRNSGTYSVPHDPEELFAIGVSDNGNYLFWITTPRERPDRWRITVNQADGQGWYTHDGSLTSFLVALLSGQVSPTVFPRDLLGTGVFFTPGPRADDNALPTSDPATRTSVSSAALRDWAGAQGYDVPDHGRLPGHIVQAWEESQ